ncbi:MAG: hypothetical protein HY829_02240 [Actinobacteria bacterium]|nr:hypothetical protein [Actinomycetota bacterium]
MWTQRSVRHVLAVSVLVLATAVLEGGAARTTPSAQAALVDGPRGGYSTVVAPSTPSDTQSIDTQSPTDPLEAATAASSGSTPAGTASAARTPAPTRHTSAPSVAPSVTGRQDLAAAVAAATNAERVAAGVTALTYRECSLPATWAVHLASVGGLTLNSLTAVLSACGGKATAGENIGFAYSTVAEVTEGWMASHGDRANIVNPTYTEISVGVAQAADGTYYWVEDFTG